MSHDNRAALASVCKGGSCYHPVSLHPMVMGDLCSAQLSSLFVCKIYSVHLSRVVFLNSVQTKGPHFLCVKLVSRWDVLMGLKTT